MLEFFFSPKSVAVIGASREKGKVGRALLDNIVQFGFKGKVFPVNPRVREIDGYKVHSRVGEIPQEIDLAIVAIPNRAVPLAIKECGQKKVKGVVVISAGFKESGQEGIKLEREITDTASRYGMRLWGPNCLGLIDTYSSLNASFTEGMPERGGMAVMSQSGALCAAILDWAKGQGLGFSKLASLGNKADICEVDLLEAWQDDPNTNVILSYLEDIRDGSKFMKVAEEVSRKKPIVIIKSGGTAAGARAASSHTGSLAGSEEAYEAAFRRSGVLRAKSLEELFDLGLAFNSQPLPRGRRVAIVTNAGGPGIMASDACERTGLTLASLERTTIDSLKSYLPPAAIFYNPVDILGDGGAERYRLALEGVLKDRNVDAVLVLLTPQAMTDIEETARAISNLNGFNKPMLTSFMGEAQVKKGIQILREHGVPNYLSPERAAATLSGMVKRTEWLKRPKRMKKKYPVRRDEVRELLKKVRLTERTSLVDVEAREVISHYGISVPKSHLATTIEEAAEAASGIGYPVVMKIASPDILHKSDIGGVKMGLQNEVQVRDSFELMMMRAGKYMPEADIWGVTIQQTLLGKEVILGMNRIPPFGPLLMFGLGGIYVEVLKDVAWRLAPLDEQEAREMVEQIHSYPLLAGVRGERPADVEAIVEALLRLSQLVTDFPEIVELDINPLKVGEVEKGAVAIDVRMTLSI
ncbi:acetate--CoA ligase family protein [candidate division NPL-UPA2 bacterium]|nr:acetate--CoA ligase family protein [candidate division NPL-UPA2 bacterium]